MTIDVKDVLDRIDVDELIKVTLDLANIDSPTGQEGPVADYVLDWLTRNGFEVRKAALYPDRPNLIATLPGTGNGRSLCFNSHMDTTVDKDEWWASRHSADPIYHTGWRDGDVLVGNGVCNCKGPMATWLLAAKAIRDANVKLAGDLVLMAVVGEIGVEPVDEFQPPKYIAKEAGTRYAITHGGVADFALVSEGTDFGIVGVEAGKAFFKITVFGNEPQVYTPYIQRPTPREKSPSAIVRMVRLVDRIEDWAAEYEQRHRYVCAGGTVVPKVNIGAIRGGVPWKITRTVQQCAIYVDCRTTPAQEPLEIKEELKGLLAEVGVPGEVELYVYRPAFEADERKGAPLKAAITRSHRAIVGGEPPVAPVPTSSMWRDLTCFNEMRIPSYTYGPGISVGGGGIYRMPIKSLVTARSSTRRSRSICATSRGRAESQGMHVAMPRPRKTPPAACCRRTRGVVCSPATRGRLPATAKGRIA